MKNSAPKAAPPGAAPPATSAPVPAEALKLEPSALPSNVALIADNGEFEALAGEGLENVTAKDVLIPRITILQSLSPQLLKNKPEFNPDARTGDLFDVAQGEVLPNPMIVVPVFFQKTWLEWAPRAPRARDWSISILPPIF